MAKKENNYRVKTTREAKEIALELIKEYRLENVIKFGLPEVDVENPRKLTP